jgi:hypothetical protein
MKHAASRELYAYWDERRGSRPAPERAEIDPGAIRHVLSDAFILGIDRGGGHPFRLAGTRICALFGRELKNDPFIGLWAAASQPTVTDLIAILDEEQVGTVAGVTAHNADGEPVDLELLLLPLSSPRPSLARAVGILAPLEVPKWLGSSPIGALHLGPRRHLGAALEVRFLPRFMSARPAPRRQPFVVHDGGRS